MSSKTLLFLVLVVICSVEGIRLDSFCRGQYRDHLCEVIFILGQCFTRCSLKFVCFSYLAFVTTIYVCLIIRSLYFVQFWWPFVWWSKDTCAILVKSILRNIEWNYLNV